MTHFITALKKNKNLWQNTLAVCFWLIVWHAASVVVDSSILLVSPFTVAKTLAALVVTGAFWHTVAFSAMRIIGGFLLAFAIGILLAAFAARSNFAQILLRPFMLTVKSVPVASFIVLALLWLKNAGNLATFISFLMVLPIVYTNTLSGILQTDAKLLEMARVLRMTFWRRVRYVYLPSVFVPLRAACAVGLGLCWKSGVAAEVIGITTGSIGAALYNAKIFFSTAELLAWTLVIVLVSLAFEKIFLRGLAVAQKILCEQKPVARPAKIEEATEIALENVSKSFGETQVLAQLSLCFAKGESVCVMAPSGAGKTTLSNLLLGVIKPDEGHILSLKNVSFAVCFQEDRLCEQLSAPANVALVTGDTARIERAFEALGMQGEDLVKPVCQLSGGQQRRVALCRAMLCGGNAVILDEPFKGLDDVARIGAANFVNAEKNGRTLICITHDETDANTLQASIFTLTNTRKKD